MRLVIRETHTFLI